MSGQRFDISSSLDEILEIAEQIEKNGKLFYERAAAAVKSKQAADLLLDLSRQEEEHRRWVSDLRQQLVPETARVRKMDRGGVVSAYLAAIAGRNVFQVAEKPERLLAGAQTEADILQMGIRAEKDSIVLYTELREAVAGEREKAGVDRLIREERKHLMDLSALQDSVAGRRGGDTAR